MSPSTRAVFAIAAACLIVASVALIAWPLSFASAGLLILGLLYITRTVDE